MSSELLPLSQVRVVLNGRGSICVHAAQCAVISVRVLKRRQSLDLSGN